ncbi:MAG: hypothetical protein LLG00_17265, partial [Planctomycetaceae bacterium]|nr:hypothetical protein [Planctomycetaceae bacterium]
AVLCVTMLWLAGCPADTGHVPGQKGGGPSQTAPPRQPVAATATSEPTVTLSTGVALPQAGPEGTMMMFSVDYEVQGEPATGGYVWVIERAKGQPAKIDRNLSKKGTLEAGMIKGWRPEDGPFHSHIEDKNGARVSESIEMTQTGG